MTTVTQAPGLLLGSPSLRHCLSLKIHRGEVQRQLGKYPDSLRYKGATPDRSSSLATPLSTDLRFDTSPVPSQSLVH